MAASATELHSLTRGLDCGGTLQGSQLNVGMDMETGAPLRKQPSRSRLAPIDDGADEEVEEEAASPPPPYFAPSSLKATKQKMVRRRRPKVAERRWGLFTIGIHCYRFGFYMSHVQCLMDTGWFFWSVRSKWACVTRRRSACCARATRWKTSGACIRNSLSCQRASRVCSLSSPPSSLARALRLRLCSS